MYNPGMNYSRESGMVLIPTRFLWPYGGRLVYISGSFTGWTQWPMAPVEGCPTLFQTICSLPSGYHEYKFVVDGEWRHDEHQPSVSSNLGTVNSILLTRESDYISQKVQPPYGASPEPITAISDADLDISRRRVTVFLSTHLAYELLPESGKVITLDVELPVKQAFHILHEQGIPMAPLWDFLKGKFVGVLSALDFIMIMRELGRNGSNLTEEELDTHTISAWKETKSHMIDREGSVSRQLTQAGPDDSLKEVALKILNNGVSTVPIIHSPSADASSQHLLHLASLSEILKCICRFFKHSPSSLPILQLPICAMPLGTWVPKIGEPDLQPLAMLRPSASLSEALNLLIQAHVCSIPIVDDNDSLLDVYSRSDITSLAKEKIYSHINIGETTIHQALQYRDDPFSAYGSNSKKCLMCVHSDPLLKVLERLSQPGVRRIFVVEAGSKHLDGIISLGDVFRFLMGV